MYLVKIFIALQLEFVGNVAVLNSLHLTERSFISNTQSVEVDRTVCGVQHSAAI